MQCVRFVSVLRIVNNFKSLYVTYTVAVRVYTPSNHVQRVACHVRILVTICIGFRLSLLRETCCMYTLVAFSVFMCGYIVCVFMSG